jgi:hypothetical protein
VKEKKMSTKRKSVEGKADPNKRLKNDEEVHEIPRVPVVEDIATARERARQWHEQQMKLRGMRGTTEERKSHFLKEAPLKSEEAPLKTRNRSRLSEVKVDEPKKREPSKRHSEIPLSGVTRTRSRGSAAAATTQVPPIRVIKDGGIEEQKRQVEEAEKECTVPPMNVTNTPTNMADTPKERNEHYRFRTIEQRRNSRPSVRADTVPREPTFSPSLEEVPPELSWISLPYISFFCILMAFVVATLFRTEQCIELMIKLKIHLAHSNYLLTQKFGDAPLGLDYTTWLSAVGVVFLFSFVL